jgi:hypothetical protein
MSNLYSVNFMDYVSVGYRAGLGESVTQNGCGFVGDGVLVLGVGYREELSLAQGLHSVLLR